LEWRHQGCDSDFSADFLNFGASSFPFKFFLKKCFKIIFFSLWRQGLELQFPTPLRVVLLCFATQKEISQQRNPTAKKSHSKMVVAIAAAVSIAAIAIADPSSGSKEVLQQRHLQNLVVSGFDVEI
jgi:hypothetical protein